MESSDSSEASTSTSAPTLTKKRSSRKVVSGSYGQVLIDDAAATVVKRTTLAYADHKGTVLSPNLTEAAMTAYLGPGGHGVAGLIRYRGARMADLDIIEVVSDRAPLGDLQSYMHRTPTARRMAVVDKLMDCLVATLNGMHACGVMHGDLKPGNVVVLDDSIDRFEVAIIDLGSCHPFGRRQGDQAHRQMCTYPYAPPEMFDGALQDADTLPLTDAYSLGALLFEFVYGSTVYDYTKIRSFESVRALHRAAGPNGVANLGAPRGAAELPPGCPTRVAAAMAGLLDPCPVSRCSVAELYFPMQSPPYRLRIADAPADAVLEGWGSRRNAAVDFLARSAEDCETLALACSLADRYVAATGEPCCRAYLTACTAAACALLAGEDKVLLAGEMRALAEVASVLRFDLLVDTCDVALLSNGYGNLDFDALVLAIKVASDGSTMGAAAAYVLIVVAKAAAAAALATAAAAATRTKGPMTRKRTRLMAAA